MNSTNRIAKSAELSGAALLRNTGANGGTLMLAAGATFRGRTVAIACAVDATFSNIVSDDNAPLYAQTSGNVITRATTSTLSPGTYFVRLREFTTNVNLVVYLDAPLSLS